MVTKTLKLEIPFQKLMSIIDQLEPDEKLILKRNLKNRESLHGRRGLGKPCTNSALKM